MISAPARPRGATSRARRTRPDGTLEPVIVSKRATPRESQVPASVDLLSPALRHLIGYICTVCLGGPGARARNGHRLFRGPLWSLRRVGVGPYYPLPPELLSRNSHEACSSPRARWRCISPRRERSISGTCLRAKALSGRADDFRDRQYDLTGSAACAQIKWSAAVCTHGELRASDGFGGGRSTSQRDKEGASIVYPIAEVSTIYTEQLQRVIKKAFAQARQRRGPEHGWAQRQRAKKCSGRAHTPGGGASTARSAGRRPCRRASSGGSERRARESSRHRGAPRPFGARPLGPGSSVVPLSHGSSTKKRVRQRRVSMLLRATAGMACQ